MKVLVLMRNDYPLRVYADAAKAETERKRLFDEERVRWIREGGSRVYFHTESVEMVQ